LKFRLVILCLVLLAIAGSAFSADSQPRYLEITFLTTNDLHAHDVPFTLPADTKNNRPAVPDIGGLARITTIVNRTRAEMRTSVVLVDSGDTTHGYTDLPKAYHGASTIAAMNAMGYVAMEPGNHEFQWHSTDPVRNLKDSSFPWVCANLVYQKTGKTFVQPYIVREIGGVRVAFFGLITDLVKQPPYLARAELGLEQLPAVDVAKKLVPELRQKADIVVLLSHLGRNADVALAQAVPGIDIILGGHSHTFIRTPQMVAVGQPSAFSLGKVPVVQAGYHGLDMGKTKVIFHRGADGQYTLMSCNGVLIDINKSIPDDPKIAKILADWTARIPPPVPAKPATPTAPAQPASK
jgi:5'-nucleotidase / UDP-sugar diphosphatase